MGKMIWRLLLRIIDRIEDNLGRIKTVIAIVFGILLILSMVRHGFDRRHIGDMVEQLTGLDGINEVLNNDIRERDLLLEEKEQRINSLIDSVESSEAKLAVLSEDYSDLEDRYQNLADSLLEIPGDSSYVYLRTVAYPFPGEDEYPFNEPQVKGMHLTYLERESLEDQNVNLREQIEEMENQICFKDSMTVHYSASVDLLEMDVADMQVILENKEEEIVLKDKQMKKKKRRDGIWKGVAGAVILTLAVIAAGGG